MLAVLFSEVKGDVFELRLVLSVRAVAYMCKRLVFYLFVGFIFIDAL